MYKVMSLISGGACHKMVTHCPLVAQFLVAVIVYTGRARSVLEVPSRCFSDHYYMSCTDTVFIMIMT